MAEKFPNQRRDLNIQVQKVRSLYYFNAKQLSSKHIIIKLPKIKERDNSKGSREKRMAEFLAEII